MRPTRIVVALLAAGLVAMLAAGAARADGDPASDYLIAQKVFFPYDAKIPQDEQRKLLAAVQSANTQGFKIRVALIWSDYDLGSVAVLWRKPRTYARFLGEELFYYFSGPLLIVMPSGFGFNHGKHDTKSAYAVLAKIPIGDTPASLAAAATTAVQKLAAAQGVKTSTTAKGETPSRRKANDRVVIVVAVLAALLLGGGLRVLIRRRAKRVSD
jgi:phosphate/sulfate permease